VGLPLFALPTAKNPLGGEVHRELVLQGQQEIRLEQKVRRLSQLLPLPERPSIDRVRWLAAADGGIVRLRRKPLEVAPPELRHRRCHLRRKSLRRMTMGSSPWLKLVYGSHVGRNRRLEDVRRAVHFFIRHGTFVCPALDLVQLLSPVCNRC